MGGEFKNPPGPHLMGDPKITLNINIKQNTGAPKEFPPPGPPNDETFLPKPLKTRTFTLIYGTYIIIRTLHNFKKF